MWSRTQNCRTEYIITDTEPEKEINKNSDNFSVSGGISEEVNYLQTMTCDEVMQRNTEGEYLSSDNRKFAREKVLACSDTEELFAINTSCEDLYERYHSGKGYWFEEHKTQTENRLAKCSSIVEDEN